MKNRLLLEITSRASFTETHRCTMVQPLMKWSKLTCPQCKALYPLGRLYSHYWSHTGPACEAKLAPSPASAFRVGAIGGVMSFPLIAALFVVVVSVGANAFWDYWYAWMALALASGYVDGPLVFSRFGELVPYDQARRAKWRDLFKKN